MLPATTSAASVSSTRTANGIDNRQVLEFLELVQGLNGLAALLAIQPAGARRRRRVHPDRQQASA
jgi:hypothetical protein